MVSVSRLEVVFSKSNVCFGGVIVAPGDGGLVDDRLLEAVSIERACVLLWAVACFVVFCVVYDRGRSIFSVRIVSVTSENR